MAYGMNGSYRVECSQDVVNDVRALHQQVLQIGLAASLVVALKTILRRLETDPHHFGEPEYELGQLGLVAYSGGVKPLGVRYYVLESEHIVFIRKFYLMDSGRQIQQG